MTESGAVIVAIGDSLTYGFPFSPQYSWVFAVGKATGLMMINKGVCGETTEDMLHRFKRDVIDIKPDYVIITGGSNDAFANLDPAEVGKNIAEMIRLAVKNGITPLIGLAPPVDFIYEEAFLRDYRKIMVHLAREYSLAIIDFYHAMLDKDVRGLQAGLSTDGVHPNEKGYGVMAQAAMLVLAELAAGGRGGEMGSQRKI